VFRFYCLFISVEPSCMLLVGREDDIINSSILVHLFCVPCNGSVLADIWALSSTSNIVHTPVWMFFAN
jgi:hypothetical protein